MSERLKILIEELGYGVVFRNVGWTECMLVRADERWVGRGRDEDEALNDALYQACPSHLARELLVRATTVEKVATPTPGDLVEEPKAVLVEAPPVIEVPVIEAPREVPLEAAHKADARSRDSALEDLDALLAKISADEDELARCAPQRQRLVLLAWIARARAIQNDFLGDYRVDDVVTNIARTIGALSKRWWPGSVPALQQAAVPADADRVLPDDEEYEAESWTEVAERAERAVRALEASDARRGFDEYGWADARACVPAPTDPNATLGAAVMELGDLDPDEATAVDVPRLVKIAQRVRFVRCSTDARAWSTTLGRLRRTAARDRFAFADLARVLDPAFVPARSWTAVVDVESPRRVEIDHAVRASEVEGVIATLPASGDVVALRAWLLRALPLTDTHHERIANACRPHTDAIVRFGVQDFAGAGRRIHRRLRKLQETLSGGEPTSVPPSEMSLPTLPVDEEERESFEIVARTRGRRAVFVTNRTDPDLQVRLRDVCEFSELDWVESAPRTIEAVANAIVNKKYDVVIAATGFLDHPVDTKLSHACRGAGVPYVRAN
ncbi:MAG TPA: hypothetical protein VH054_30465, partial [Polyangiaceae bacterium]|nr:hypothetical protein [Polyangiaceae bacterium]